jgi:hypothetical protein
MTDIHAEGPILTFRRADSQQCLQIHANLSAEEAGARAHGRSRSSRNRVQKGGRRWLT